MHGLENRKMQHMFLLQSRINFVILHSWKLIALFSCLLLNETDRSGIMTNWPSPQASMCPSWVWALPCLFCGSQILNSIKLSGLICYIAGHWQVHFWSRVCSILLQPSGVDHCGVVLCAVHSSCLCFNSFPVHWIQFPDLPNSSRTVVVCLLHLDLSVVINMSSPFIM